MEECGKKKTKKTGSILQQLTVDDMRKYLKQRGVTKGVDKMKRAELCETIVRLKQATPPKMNGLLSYDGYNSCYMDSGLVALFHSNRRWLKRRILNPFKSPRRIPHHQHTKANDIMQKIQTELRMIYKHLFSHSTPSNNYRCSNIRRLFQQFDKEYQQAYKVRLENIDWIRTQQEPRDFFDLLMRVFDIRADVKMSVNGDMRKAYFNSPYVPASDLKMATSSPVKFNKYFPVYRDVTKIRYESGDVICFNVERNFLDEKVSTPFSFPEKTKLSDGTVLHLKSIIIHHGSTTKSGHYTCLINESKQWYHFDDIGPQFDKIGNFKKAIEWRQGYIMKNCTNLIYAIS
jgi:uncharacterized UBP type Zn finger protein